MTTQWFSDGHVETWDDAAPSTTLAAAYRRLCTQVDPTGYGGGWVSLSYLTDAVRYMVGGKPTQPTVDAACRALRHPDHGGHIVEAEHGRRRIIPHGSPRWETIMAARKLAAKDPVEQAADDLSAWLNKWGHVITDTHAQRITSMAGAILRDAAKPQADPDQGTLI